MADRVRIAMLVTGITTVHVDDVDVTATVQKIDLVDRRVTGEAVDRAFVDGTAFPVIIDRDVEGHVFVAETPTGVLDP